ncbi:hypothetical protein ACFSZS_25875 [Seohaeicola zhoushanensis]
MQAIDKDIFPRLQIAHKKIAIGMHVGKGQNTGAGAAQFLEMWPAVGHLLAWQYMRLARRTAHARSRRQAPILEMPTTQGWPEPWFWNASLTASKHFYMKASYTFAR